MKILRSIASVVLGYLVFAIAAVLFFKLSGQPPHAPAPPSIMAASILVGIVAAFAGGFIAASLAGRKP
jgi:RsiW-degrading membrane proteinase PrsW (M82 family)